MLSSRAPTSAWPVLVIALAILPYCTMAASAAAQEPSPKPNIVLILTDDEDVAIHEFMPKTRALLADQGTTFNNFFVSYAFCCPSRASILRGQYGHNTQVLGNELPYGGYEKLHQRGLERSRIATWLQAAVATTPRCSASTSTATSPNAACRRAGPTGTAAAPTLTWVTTIS